MYVILLLACCFGKASTDLFIRNRLSGAAFSTNRKVEEALVPSTFFSLRKDFDFMSGRVALVLIYYVVLMLTGPVFSKGATFRL